MVDVFDQEHEFQERSAVAFPKWVCINISQHQDGQKKVLSEDGVCPECGQALTEQKSVVPF